MGFSIWIYLFGFSRCNGLIIRLLFFLLLSRTGTVGWTKCWVKVPKCAVPDHCAVYTGSELSSSSRRLRREPDTPKYHHRWFHIARIWARVTRIGFWLFNYVMMASYQWLCIETYLILKSYIKHLFDQETAYVHMCNGDSKTCGEILCYHPTGCFDQTRSEFYDIRQRYVFIALLQGSFLNFVKIQFWKKNLLKRFLITFQTWSGGWCVVTNAAIWKWTDLT